MRKLLFSVLALGVVSVLAISATRAYFTDTATVAGNSIQTGTVDVTLSTSGTTLVPLTVNNILPGWVSQAYTVRSTNTGTVPLKYAWSAAYTGGDGTLYNTLDVRMEDDAFCAGTQLWQKYPVPANPVSGPFTASPDGDPLSGLSFIPTSYLNLNVGAVGCTRFTFTLPVTAGNILQGKTTQFNLVIHATQVDNPGFSE
ncbi:MAG: SipW-dependent-type signal peptide-containing protein [Candidatus Dojkabacteria bacterium]